MKMNKLHIEKNTVQETLIIPLYARKLCSDRFPDLFYDPDCYRLIERIDYDFSPLERKAKSEMMVFGALEVSSRQYDLACEVKDYLRVHPKAAVINMGCGLDMTGEHCDNGTCHIYNLDFRDVIDIRNRLIEPNDRTENVSCDLNDTGWFDRISFKPEDGAVFFAAGVFYYFTREQIRTLFTAMQNRFPGAVIVFDACGPAALKMMMKTWIKEAGIKDIGAYFSVKDTEELKEWFSNAEVTSKGYMEGYRKLPKTAGFIYRILAKICDKSFIRMKIIKIAF